MKTPDYLSYERYKKKKDNNPNKRMMLFVTTFFATLLVFTVVAKSLSPDVDVTIGDESQTEAKDTGLGVKKFIDERLKMIQMDDSSAGVSIKKDAKKSSGYESEEDNYANDYYQASEEKMSVPKKKQADAEDTVLEEPITLSPTRVQQPPRPTGRDLSKPYESPKVSKVYVGRYATQEQARVAQEILMDSGLGITPFIKNAGSYYTLQIGSYTSRAKADGLASELQRNSFPARVVQE